MGTRIFWVGTRLVGSNGNGANQLDNPWGIFVDTNENIYVANNSGHSVVNGNLALTKVLLSLVMEKKEITGTN